MVEVNKVEKNGTAENEQPPLHGQFRETRRDDFDSDGESIASDTDSFVNVGGSTGSVSDSEWEKVSLQGDSSDEDASDSDPLYELDDIDLRFVFFCIIIWFSGLHSVYFFTLFLLFIS